MVLVMIKFSNFLKAGSAILLVATVSQAVYFPTTQVTQPTGSNLHVQVDSAPAVTGTVAATQSGTWTVQPGNTQNSTAWLVQDASNGTVAAGTAATKSSLGGGVFNTALPTLTTGQQAAIQLDSSGRQIMGTSAAVIGGVTQSGTWNVTNVSGTVSLPTGAATAAKQPALGTAGTPSTDVITVQGRSGMTALVVDGSAVTQPVSAVSLPLPSGASTSALQTTGNSTLSAIAAQLPATLGQKTSANSMAVVISSDQSAVLTKGPTNATPSLASGTATTTPTAVTAPSNTVTVMIQALDTNTANLRVAFGATCSSSNGWQLQPGRSETLDVGANASICSESGSQGYVVQWIAQ